MILMMMILTMMTIVYDLHNDDLDDEEFDNV